MEENGMKVVQHTVKGLIPKQHTVYYLLLCTTLDVHNATVSSILNELERF